VNSFRFYGSPVYQARPAPTIRRAGQLLRPDSKRRFTIKSKGALVEMHDHWVERLNRAGCQLHELQYMAAEFPPPPDLWCPNGRLLTVTPIGTPKELVSLGRECHNCCAAWAYRVANAGCFFYRVQTENELVTLAVHKPGADWVVLEMKAPSNSDPSPETAYLVRQWLLLAQGRDALIHPWDLWQDDDIPF
jgi:hypothetical protein